MKEPSRTISVVGGFSLLLLLVLLSNSPGAFAQAPPHLQDAVDRYLTQTASSQWPFCNPPGCVPLAEGGDAYTSDYDVIETITIIGAHDQEVFKWQAITPTKQTINVNTLTFTQSTQCFTWSMGGSACGQNYVTAGVPNPLTFQPTGSWTLQFFDDGVLTYSHQFNLSHNGSGPLGIVSPVDNQLIDLAPDQNYTATDATCGPPIPTNGTNATAVCLSAGTNTGHPIDWTVTLQYATSQFASTGTGTSFTDSRTFTTTSAQVLNEFYQSEGGKVVATATTTAGDGSTLQDRVTFYTEGPIGGIPGPPTPTNPADVISPELTSLYPPSYSYRTYLSDGTPPPTPNLMTGVAYHETQYRQFTSPADNPPNSDLWSLYASSSMQIAAKWPDENLQTQTVPRGKNIGLMQVATAANQTPNAWNWVINATDAVNLFSYGSVTVDDWMQEAVKFESYLINGYKSGGVNIPKHVNGDSTLLRSLHGSERENNALVLYAGDVAKCNGGTTCTVNSLYYIPSCPAVTTTKGSTTACSTTWQWVANTGNQTAGLLYVSNNSQDSWYDQFKQPGVREELH